MFDKVFSKRDPDPFLADIQSTISSLDGIVAAITQTNSKIQLILKHLLSIIDTRATQMIPKEICQYSQLLVDLKTSCYLDEDDQEAKRLANKDIIVDDVENEEEESPTTN